MGTSEAKLLLDVKGLGIQFGGLKAVSDFDIKIKKSELIGLIGPNGAGKTTVFNLLTGVYVPTEGEIVFNDENITGLPPFKVTRKGISRTFQNIRLFDELSVLDNVKIGNHTLANHSIMSSIFRFPHIFLRKKRWKKSDGVFKNSSIRLFKDGKQKLTIWYAKAVRNCQGAFSRTKIATPG